MRWKYVIPAVVVVALILVFNLFFLDSILKWGLVAGGELAFGARVEVARVRTKLSTLSVAISGLQVADKNAPLKNLFEVGEIRFGVEPLPLLSKKVIIDSMNVTGVRWGTARKISGALPPRKQAKITHRWQNVNSPLSKLSTAVTDQGQAKLAALPAVEALRAAQEQIKGATVAGKVKPENLPMLKEMDAMKAGYQQKAADYQTRLQQLQVQDKLNALGPAWNEVSALKIQNPQDLLAAKDKFDRLNKSLQDLQTTATAVNTLKAQAEADYGAQQALLDKINALKNRDLAQVGSLLKLPTFDFSSLTSSLLGPMWAGRLKQALELTAKARTYMPAGKSKGKKTQPVVQPRMHGLDVRFPAYNRPPDFWIKRVELAGSTGGPGKTGAPIDFSGTVTDVTSDPALLGSPLKADLTGAQGARRLAVQAVLDHTREIPSDRFHVTMAGLKPDELGFPKSEYLPDFKSGSATLAAQFALTGEQVEASLDLSVAGLSVGVPAQAVSLDSVADLAPALWRGVDRLQVGAVADGTAENLALRFTSNLDKILNDRMQALIGGQLAGIQQQLRAEVDKLVAGKQSDLLASYAGSKDGVLGSAAQQAKALTDKIADAKKLIQDKQDAGNQALEQQKQQGQEQLKNSLKGFLGK
jgi:uncharacterized protein (TIGR03545 family)